MVKLIVTRKKRIWMTDLIQVPKCLSIISGDIFNWFAPVVSENKAINVVT